MSIPLDDDGNLTHVARLIAATEMRTSAQTAALLALVKSGRDTREAEEALWRSMDVLLTLRRQQLQVRSMLMDDAGSGP